MASIRRALRRSLWKASPVCHWCGVVTQIDGDADDFATLDHLYPRGDSRRGGDEWDVTKIVLACRKCNLSRGNTRLEDTQALAAASRE